MKVDVVVECAPKIKNIGETNQKLLFIKTIIFANKCHYCFPFQNVSNYLVRELFTEVETKQ